MGCLVLHQRYKKKFEKYLVLSKEVSSDSGITESTTSLIQSNSSQEILPATDINFSINNRVRHLSKSDDFISNDDSDQMSPECSNAEECCTRKSTATTVVDIEDLVGNKGVGFSAADGEYNQNAGTSGGLCSSTFNCNGSARQTCEHLIREYHRHQAGQGLLEPLELPENVDEHQTMKHIVLLILLLCAMFVVSLMNFVCVSSDFKFDFYIFYRDWLCPYGLWLWKVCLEFMLNSLFSMHFSILARV